MTDEQRTLVFALIGQVTMARPQAGNERDVTTVITRPLWQRWNTALGYPPDTPPSEEWIGVHTHRVYGSRTIVIESEHEAAVSYVTKPELS